MLQDPVLDEAADPATEGVLDRIYNAPPRPSLYDMGFRRLPDDEVRAGFELVDLSKGWKDGIVPSLGNVPLLGPSFTLDRVDELKGAQARMQLGRASVEDERLVFGALVNEGRASGFGNDFWETLWGFGTTMAEFYGGSKVAKVLGGTSRAVAQKALSNVTRSALQRASQTAVGRLVRGAAPLATTLALQEAVPQAAGALGFGVEGGAWTAQAVMQAIGEPMTDEEAQEIADGLHSAIPMLLEKGGGIWEGLARQAIEVGVEGTGGALRKLPPFAQIDTVIGGLLAKLSGHAKVVGWPKALAEAAQYQGPGGEVAEDYLVAVLNGVLMGDDIPAAVAEVTERAPATLAAASVFPVGGALANRAASLRGSMKAPSPEASATEGGDPTAAASVPTGGEAAASGEAPAAPAAAPAPAPPAPKRSVAGLDSLRAAMRARAGVDVDVTPVEPQGTQEEAAAAFAARRGYAVQFYERGETPDGAPALEDAFYPGSGNTVFIRRGAPDVGAVAVHEGVHLWEAQQTPERRADLSAALREIDGPAVAKIAKGLARSPLYRGRPAAELESEVRAGVAQAVSGLVRMLDTAQGQAAFVELTRDPGGPVRRLLSGLYDWVAEKIRLLPRSRRARARAALRLARGEEDSARLAQRVLDALKEIDARPIETLPETAGEELGLGPDEGMADTATRETSREVATPRDISRVPLTTKEERRAVREARKAERKVSNTPLPGDTVEYMRESPTGATIKVTGTVLETTGSGANTRLRIRINEDVARAGEGRRAASENRARRAANELVVDRGRVRLVAKAAAVDPTSKTAKNRARAEAEQASGAEPRFAAAEDVPGGQFAAALYNQMPAMIQRPLRKYLDGLRSLWQDNTIPLREVFEVRANVKRYRAQMPDRLRRFQDDLQGMLKPFKGEQLDDVQRAVYLQAAIQRNAWMLQERGVQDAAGISTADAQTELAILEQALGPQRLATLFAEHARLNAQRLAHMEEVGFIGPQQVAEWGMREPNWVSMRDVDPDSDEHLGFGASGRSMQVRNPQVRRAEGRDTEVEQPLLAWASEYAMRIVAAEKNRALRDAAAAGVESTEKPMGVPGGFSAPDTHVAYVENGQQRYLVMDNEAQAEVLKGLDGETLGLVTRMFGTATRAWGRAVTGQNPAFWLFNFLRDTFQAGFYTVTERGIPYATKVYTRAWTVLPRMMRYQLNGDAAGMPMLDTAQRRGFKTTWAGRRTLREQLNWMRDVVEGRSGVRAKLRAVLGFLEQVGDSFEMATRYATFEVEYQRQIKAGATQEEAEQLAGDYAREITLNFDTKGSLTTHASAYFAFFNPAVQGSARLLQVALSKRGIKFMGSLVAAGYLMEAVNYALADDDERTGLNLYGSLPEWEKSRNIILPIWKDKQPLKITLPYGLDAVYGLGRRMFLLTSGRDVDPRIEPKKVIWQGLLQAATSFNPLGDISDPYSMVTPTVLRPFVEIDRNRKFGDRPIMRPGESFGRTVPDSARAFESINDRASGWIAQHIADVLNFNGPDELPTGFDVSPESVQHLIEFVGGGFGLREVDRMSEFFLSDKPTVPGANVPVLRGFVGAVTDHYISELYYNIAERGSTMQALASNPANSERMATIADEDRRAWQMRGRVARVDRKLSELRRRLRADGTPQEEQEQIRERMTEMQAAIVRAYYGTEK